MPDIKTVFARNLSRLLDEHNETQAELADEMHVAPSSVSGWCTGAKMPRMNKVEWLAAHFNVSRSALLEEQNETEPTPQEPALTAKDERDIAHKLNEVLDQLSGDSALMFDGEPLDDVTRDLLRDSLENQFRTAKVLAKQKYTPKKYRKDE